jgi:hypothetical protein
VLAAYQSCVHTGPSAKSKGIPNQFSRQEEPAVFDGRGGYHSLKSTARERSSGSRRGEDAPNFPDADFGLGTASGQPVTPKLSLTLSTRAAPVVALSFPSRTRCELAITGLILIDVLLLQVEESSGICIKENLPEMGLAIAMMKILSYKDAVSTRFRRFCSSRRRVAGTQNSKACPYPGEEHVE